MGATSAEDFGTGSNSCAGSKTTFDDEAADDLEDLDLPHGHVGTVKPQNAALSGFDGSSMKGAWWLAIVDDVSGDEGTLGCVELKIKYKKTRC